MADYLKFKCIFCGQSMEVDRKHAGRHIKCPACDHKITIPGGQVGASDPRATNLTWTKEIPSPKVSTPTRYQNRSKTKAS